MTHIVEIKVVPNSGRQQLLFDKTRRLKCYLKSPPEKGLANQELIRYIAKVLNAPLSSLRIIAGATGRTKLVQITTTRSKEELLTALGIEHQQQLFK